MHFHWQNLNEKPGKRKGSGLRHGRAWWRLGGSGERDGIGVNWEWSFFSRSAGLRLGFTNHDDVGVQLWVQIPCFVALYITLHGGVFAWLTGKVLPWRDVPAYTFHGINGPYQTKPYRIQDPREISLRFFDWAVWWDIWVDDMQGWHKRGRAPWWRKGNWHPLDTFFGRHKYASRELSTTQAQVAMPEGAYPCTVKLTEDSWKRPRLPWRRRVLRAHMEMHKAVPHPGKGENSWDCGEDATSAMTCCAATVEEAIAKMTESVLNSRRRHGGSVNWRPSESDQQVS
jgi:hypothetical protein